MHVVTYYQWSSCLQSLLPASQILVQMAGFVKQLHMDTSVPAKITPLEEIANVSFNVIVQILEIFFFINIRYII